MTPGETLMNFVSQSASERPLHSHAGSSGKHSLTHRMAPSEGRPLSQQLLGVGWSAQLMQLAAGTLPAVPPVLQNVDAVEGTPPGGIGMVHVHSGGGV